MARKALVDAAGNVVNVIEIAADSNWPVPAGCSLVSASAEAEPGGTYTKGKFARASRVNEV